MFRARASRIPARVALAAILLMTSAVPVSAAGSVNTVITTSSPQVVTVGLPVAYPVSVTNDGKSTLNNVKITGVADPAFDYLFALPEGMCSDEEPVCDLGQLAAGVEVPEIIFYFTVPETPGSYDFKVITTVSEADRDNSDDNAAAQDTFVSNIVTTSVLATSPDFVSGHSVPGIRTFSTGLGSLNALNKHGTQLTVPANAEVTVEDLTDGHPLADCGSLVDDDDEAVSLPCFGESSFLSVADGMEFPQGLLVTMRWDFSDLPKGMTDKKLRIVHLLDDGRFERVEDSCIITAGVPTNMPCLVNPPKRQSDKDIVATFYLDSNRVSRGY